MEWNRRRLLILLALGGTFLHAASNALRGTLKPGLTLMRPDGDVVALDGDEETRAVLQDARLAGADFEVLGAQSGAKFLVGPIHTSSMFVHKGGKRLTISYWCDICAIRTYSPGLCQCCREETQLQLREPA